MVYRPFHTGVDWDDFTAKLCKASADMFASSPLIDALISWSFRAFNFDLMFVEDFMSITVRYYFKVHGLRCSREKRPIYFLLLLSLQDAKYSANFIRFSQLHIMIEHYVLNQHVAVLALLQFTRAANSVSLQPHRTRTMHRNN